MTAAHSGLYEVGSIIGMNTSPAGQPARHDHGANGSVNGSEWSWICERVIPSDAAEGKLLLDEVIKQLEAGAWQELDIFGIHLSVEEAIVNAIKHGNKYDLSKRVRINCKISPRCMRIEIEDEGQGFDPAAVPDCTQDDRLEFASGRGLMLMRNFMSLVEYSARGNCVVMEKRRD